jgi:hypothetical protein
MGCSDARMMGGHMRCKEPGSRKPIPIHVLIQSHVQPGDGVFQPSEHVAKLLSSDRRRIYARLVVALQRRAEGKDSGGLAETFFV